MCLHAQSQPPSAGFAAGGFPSRAGTWASWFLAASIGFIVAALVLIPELVLEDLSATQHEHASLSAIRPGDVQSLHDQWKRHLESAEQIRRYKLVLAPVAGVAFLGLLLYSRRLAGKARLVQAERQAQLDAVRASDERFRQMADTIREAFWISDPELNSVLYVSPAYEKIWGRSCQSLYDRPLSFADAIHPEDQPRVLLEREGLREGREYSSEYRVIRPDGAVRWVWDQGFPIRNANGEVYRATGIARDITERKRVEETLAQRNRLSTLGAEIGFALTHNEELGRMLNHCAEAVVRYVDAAFARIWMLNEPEGMLELQASAGMYTHIDGAHSRIPLGKFKIGLIAQERKPHLTNEVVGDPRVSDQEWAQREGIVSFAGYPLIVGDRVVGVLGMFARQPLPAGVLQELAAVSDAIALGISRKQDEEEREKFFALVENSSDFVGMATLEGQPFYLNAAGCRMVGLDNPKEVGSTQLQDYYDASNWALIHNVALPAMHRHGQWEGEVQVRHFKTGELIDVHRHSFIVRKPGTGEPMCWATVQRDITERKRAEQSLRLLSSAIEQSADNIVITGRNGAIKYANPAFLRLSGLTREEVIGKTPRVVKSGKHGAGFYKELWQTVMGGEPFRAEFINKKKDGELYIEEKTITPVLDADGSITHFVATGRDITERRRAEEELNKLNRQLLEASRRAGMAEVASNVLHNVGNVLNSVNVSTSVLLEKIKSSKTESLRRVAALIKQHRDRLADFLARDEKGRQVPAFLESLGEHLLGEQQELLKEIALVSSNMEHIKEIIAMQQNYARVSGIRETVSVTDLVEDALRMNQGAFARHETRVIREFADVPPITVEKHKVLQILVNLLRNAKYALDEGGKKEKLMRLRVEKNGGDFVKISVIDNGIGIPQENLTRIFAHGFTTRKNGHGFGLHSGALAAQELGGSLKAKSEGLGQGATFTLELPLTDPKETNASIAH